MSAGISTLAGQDQSLGQNNVLNSMARTLGKIKGVFYASQEPFISAVTVAATPTPITSYVNGRRQVRMRNDSLVDIDLCNQNNATYTGVFTLEPGDSITFHTEDDRVPFYAKVDSGTATLQVVEMR